MKKAEADTINWSIYDRDFVDWLFYTYVTVEQMPSKKIIILMSVAFAEGKDTGYTEGYTKAREDCW